jgi:S1-C subfamily serine protease
MPVKQLFAMVLALSLVPAALAQDAVPTDILKRTLFIKGPSEAGTAFCVEHEGKLYLVTAKHVVADLPKTNATLQVMKDGTWTDFHTVKTIFPSSPDVDIAIFETDEKVQPFEVPLSEGDSVTMGQQVWFLGYPWGLGSRWANGKGLVPFIKRGTMSAVDGTNPKAIVLYIDGFNNPGFSGGPIVYYSFSKHAYRILGVVKGYREDTAKVLVNGEHVDTKLLVNSGILIGYSAEHVTEAIEGK